MKLNPAWQYGVRSYRRRLFCIIWLMEMCKWFTGALFFSGIAAAVLRWCEITNWHWFVFFFSFFFLTASGWALVRAFLLLPSEEKSVVFLSTLVPGGALILSALECGGTEIPQPEFPPLPRIRCLRWKGPLSALLAAAVFCAGALTVPLNDKSRDTEEKKLDLHEETRQLVKKLEYLSSGDEKIKQRAAALKKELEESVREADPENPGRTYELLSRLNMQMQDELEKQSRQQGELMRQLSALSQAAEKLSVMTAAGKNSENFTRALKSLAEKNPALAQALKKGGFDGAQLSREELSRLAASLKTDAGKLKRALKEMSRFSESAAAMCDTDSAGGRAELENFLRENVPGCDDLIESLTNRSGEREPSSGGAGEALGREPASGGVSGDGSALLEYSGYTVDYGARHKDRKVVPHGAIKKEGSTLLGAFASETTREEMKDEKKGGTLKLRDVRSGFQESTVYPAHRRAVRKYFENRGSDQ